MKKTTKPSYLLWGAGALAVLAIARSPKPSPSPAKKAASPAPVKTPAPVRAPSPVVAPSHAPKPAQTSSSVAQLQTELSAALASKSWSPESKITLQAVKEALVGSPHTTMEILSATHKPQAAYDSLAALKDTERQAFTKEVYYRENKNTFSVDKRAAAIAAWVYFNLGGQNAAAIQRGQSLAGAKQTGKLDAETKQSVQSLSTRPFWTPTLVHWGLAEAVQGLTPPVTQQRRIQFLEDHWDELLAYAPMMDDYDEEEEDAFTAALESYQDDMLDPLKLVDPEFAALNAYKRAYQYYGEPALSENDTEVKEFLLGVLGRIDDMMLFQAMQAKGYTEARIQKAWGRRGPPPGSEEEGFLS